MYDRAGSSHMRARARSFVSHVCRRVRAHAGGFKMLQRAQTGPAALRMCIPLFVGVPWVFCVPFCLLLLLCSRCFCCCYSSCVRLCLSYNVRLSRNPARAPANRRSHQYKLFRAILLQSHHTHSRVSTYKTAMCIDSGRRRTRARVVASRATRHVRFDGHIKNDDNNFKTHARVPRKMWSTSLKQKPQPAPRSARHTYILFGRIKNDSHTRANLPASRPQNMCNTL